MAGTDQLHGKDRDGKNDNGGDNKLCLFVIWDKSHMSYFCTCFLSVYKNVIVLLQTSELFSMIFPLRYNIKVNGGVR